MSLRETKQKLANIEYLQELGYNIPSQFNDILQEDIDKNSGIKQVWSCEKCSWTYKSPVTIVQIACPKDHVAKLIEEYLI